MTAVGPPDWATRRFPTSSAIMGANSANALSHCQSWSSVGTSANQPRADSKFDVGGQPLQTAFTTEPALLVAAKWAGGIKLVVGICPDHAGAQFANGFEDLA